MQALARSSIKRTYYQRLYGLFGSSLSAYWSLGELSGTSAVEAIRGYNGVYANTVLAQAGIGDGNKSSLMNGLQAGASSNISVYSSAFATDFPTRLGSEGCFAIFYKPLNVGVWTDGQTRILCRFAVDANNKITIIKIASTNSVLECVYLAGGTNKIANSTPLAFTDFALIVFNWSKSGDLSALYVNSALQIGTNLAGLGTWAGSPISTAMMIGGNTPTSTQTTDGYLQHAIMLNRPMTVAEQRQLVSWSTINPKFISIIGDSIAAAAIGWPPLLANQYNSGNTAVLNHAITSLTIIADMDSQTVACVNDNSDIIILALGVNDNDAGNMATLQAEVEENIVELKASNPNATLYYMNVLPKWTDSGGGTPVAKGNIRTAIAAACTAQSITCWDTFTTPWITAGQTSDGTHPTATGHAAIATQVLARLP